MDKEMVDAMKKLAEVARKTNTTVAILTPKGAMLYGDRLLLLGCIEHTKHTLLNSLQEEGSRVETGEVKDVEKNFKE